MATNGYGRTLSVTTTAGSTAIGKDVKIMKMTNTDATNFVTLSFNGEIDAAGEEFILLAGESISFEFVGGVRTDTLYHDADTATIALSIAGIRA